MRVLVVSGIWPPDLGGPASHAPEVADYLAARGHDVEVVTTAERPPLPRTYPVHWVSRRLPRGIRHLRAAERIGTAGRYSDVVYSAGMLTRSALGTTLVRAPLVQRLASGPAYERALRLGLTLGPLHHFEQRSGLLVGLLRWAQDRALARAVRIVCPSTWLRDIILGWGVAPERVEVLPHALQPPQLPDRGQLRRELGFEGKTLVFAGRLITQKSLDVALRAVSLTDGVTLVLAGDGPERNRAEALAAELGLAARTRFLGAQPRERVFELFRAADAALLASSWESFALVVAEALAVGTPVLSTAAGAVTEVLEDGKNALVTPVGDEQALAGSIRRFFGDEALRGRLQAAAPGSVAGYAPERIYGRLERILEEAAR